MLRPYTRRLLLLLPTTTYRTAAFVEAARRLGVELTVASERPSTFEGAQPAAFLTLDFAAPERAAEQAAEFARRHPVAGVVGVDDDTAVLAAAIAGPLGRIPAQPDVVGCGDWTSRVLVEDFIPGPEVALEGLVVAGRLDVLALFDKPDPLDGPFFEETIYTTPSRLPQRAQAALGACAHEAVEALGLREGPVHAELRWNESGPWLIELAARSIGGRCSAALRFGAGETSLEEIVIRHALGMPLPSLERERQASGVMMIPVPTTGVLRELRGVAAARTVPLIEDVVITAHPGQMLLPWPEGWRYPGFIFARGETPEAVEAALRTAHRRLEFIIE